MTANHAHTPLDDLVLRMHIRFGAANTMGDDHSADDFASVIRILENMPAKIAAAEQRGAERALRDAAESPDLIGHMYREYDEHPLRSMLAPSAVRATAAYLHNRVDRIADQEVDDE